MCIINWGSGNNIAITTKEQLKELSVRVNRGERNGFRNVLFTLGQNIDFEENEEWIPIGNNAYPFRGKFDGKGFVISGINISVNSNYQGLFGISAGEIINLGVNVNITTNCWINELGITNNGTVENNRTNRNIPATRNHIGGLAGENKGRITSCFSTGNVAGDMFVGGLVGINSSNGIIVDCYSNSKVTGGVFIGGLVGENWGNINNSYASGNVSGNGNLGGLVGKNSNNIINYCYYDTQTTGQSDTGKGDPKTTAEMKTKNTYINCNFTSVWDIDTTGIKNYGYPFLR